MKKYLLVGALLLTMIMTLVACGSEKPSGDTDVKTSATDQAEVEVPDDSDKPDNTENPVEPDNTDEPVKPDDTEDIVEPSDTEDPVAEMVDWETWATQADNDEVCMVVWNETTGTQKILQPTTAEKPFIYNVEEGDRFAVPRRDNVSYVKIGFETRIYWESENQKYIEFELPVGEMKQVYIVCNDREKAISYLFNY